MSIDRCMDKEIVVHNGMLHSYKKEIIWISSNEVDEPQFSSVQSLSHVRIFATPWITAHQASLSITNSWCSPKLMSVESVMPSSHLILCRPLLLLPPIPPSIRVFSSESTLCIRWPKYWSFSLSPSNEHPGLVSFRMDWLELLAVQGTLKSLLQHHSSKASILQHSKFNYSQIIVPKPPGVISVILNKGFLIFFLLKIFCFYCPNPVYKTLP